MAYALYTQAYGDSNANLPVTIKEAGTGIPAVILSSATGGMVNDQGLATLDASGNLSVYIDTAKTWTVVVVDDNGIGPVSATIQFVDYDFILNGKGKEGISYILKAAYSVNGSVLYDKGTEWRWINNSLKLVSLMSTQSTAFLAAAQAGTLPKNQLITVDGQAPRWSTDGYTWTSLDGDAVSVAENTLLHIGPSYCARITPFFQILPSTWSRTNGIGSFRTQNDAVDWPVGRRFRIQDTNNPWLEGFFEVLTNTPEASRSRITYVDARPDKTSSDVIGNSIGALDLNSWSSASGTAAYLSIATGGAVRVVTLGTNGLGLNRWFKVPERLAQIRSVGRVGVILIDGGTVGSTMNDEGLSQTEAWALLKEVVEICRPLCKVLAICTPPPYDYTSVPVNGGPYASVSAFIHKLYRLAKLYPFVRIIPHTEGLITRYGGVDTTELIQGQQPPNDLCNDAVHDQQGGACAKGTLIGAAIGDLFRPKYNLGGSYTDSRWVATGTGLDGSQHPNLISGFFGAVPTNAASGTLISGTKPTAGTVTGVLTGSMSVVSKMVLNPDGGWDWVCTFKSPTTNPTATTVWTQAWTGGRSAGEILTAINQAANQNKWIDIFVDCGVGGFGPGGMTYVDLALWVTTAAEGEWREASGFSKEGDNQAVSQNKVMTSGFSGIVRFPRFKLLPRTYTAAELRFTCKPTQGTTGRTTEGFRSRVGPGTRIEIVEDI